MALNAPRPAARLLGRALRSSSRPTILSSSTQRPFSSTSGRLQQDAAASSEIIPRWAMTPERMKAPFSQHVRKTTRNNEWRVNEDPQKLDDALENLLGNGGDRLLPDELKWLAVTHKSFDQGRRGFNDRLAYLGRQIAAVEGMQHIIASPKIRYKSPGDGYTREPFVHPALNPANNLCKTRPDDVFDMNAMKKLAMDTGIMGVVRWRPRNTDKLKASGLEPIMTATIYAIVGAIALQHGGKVASKILRDRIIKRLRPF